MKTTITATLALTLLAATAQAALAQDAQGGWQPGHGRGDRGHQGGGQQPVQHGPYRAQGEAPRAPAAPQAIQAPPAPAAVTPPAVARGERYGGERAFNGRGPDGQAVTGARPSGERPDRRGGDRAWTGRGPGDRPAVDGREQNRRDGDRRDWNRGPGDGRDWNRQGGDRGWQGRDNGHDRPRWERGRYPPVYRSPYRYNYNRYRPPIGFYLHSWSFGETLPRGWYEPDYRLVDWWSFGLPEPPPGFDWIRVGDDVLLVDRFSGRVVQVVRDLFW